MKTWNVGSGAVAPGCFYLSPLIAKVSFGAIVLAIAWFAPSQVSATSFNAFYSFGDSSIDSGWWVGALNGQCDGAAAPCATGSAGRNALIADGIANGGTGAPVGVGLMRSQDIAAHYGLTAIPANQPGGTNYAISGALSVAVAGDGNLNLNPNLPSAATQIANYLGAHANLANPSGLYVLSAGANDITYAVQNFLTTPERQTFLANQAAAYAAAIQALQVAGAQTIVVDGIGGSGFLATFRQNVLLFDLSQLNVNFIFADIAGVVQDVKNNPTLYGFTAATVLPGSVGAGTSSACVTQTGAGATTTGGDSGAQIRQIQVQHMPTLDLLTPRRRVCIRTMSIFLRQDNASSRTMKSR